MQLTVPTTPAQSKHMKGRAQIKEMDFLSDNSGTNYEVWLVHQATQSVEGLASSSPFLFSLSF